MPDNPNIRESDSQLLASRAAQVQRGGARAAVLGVNDGLVSTLCIVLAVAAAGVSSQSVLLAGFAGLIAGAVSMAAGEWISVRAQEELFQGILDDLKQMVSRDRVLLEENLANTFMSHGVSAEHAIEAASDVATKEKDLNSVYASQVIGINPDELGSPWVAAGSSFLLFTLGALAPLAPWFFVGGGLAMWLSIIFTVAGGLFAGGYVASSSGKNIMGGALRQLFIIALAAAVTYGVGYVFGTVVN